MKIRLLTPTDVEKALPMPLAIDAMHTAFASLQSGNINMPVRLHINIPEHEGTALFMPSHIADLKHLAIKTVTLFGKNPQLDIPRIQGMVCLFDGKTGTTRAIIDGATLTAIRTGAVSGLATKHLARHDATNLTLIGTGAQALSQLKAVLAVRNITHTRVFSRNHENAARFATTAAEQLNINIEPSPTVEHAVSFADIITCVTTSHKPVYDHNHLKPGVHINAVGSYQHHVQEIPPETVLNSKLVVDHKESALDETGDLLIPMKAGQFDPETMIHAELGQIVTNQRPARESDQEITLFKSVGVAVQDLAAAHAAFQNAESNDIGTVIDWH